MPRAFIMVALLAVLTGDALACCDVNPLAADTFPSTLGSANRPYAAPGETLELRLRTCDDSAGFGGTETSYVATVAFRPPGGGPPRLVAVATSCTDVNVGACGATPTTCHAAPDAVRLVERDGERRLLLRFPDTDAQLAPAGDGRTLAGPAIVAVTTAGSALPCALATGTCAAVKAALGGR